MRPVVPAHLALSGKKTEKKTVPPPISPSKTKNIPPRPNKRSHPWEKKLEEKVEEVIEYVDGPYDPDVECEDVCVEYEEQEIHEDEGNVHTATEGEVCMPEAQKMKKLWQEDSPPSVVPANPESSASGSAYALPNSMSNKTTTTTTTTISNTDDDQVGCIVDAVMLDRMNMDDDEDTISHNEQDSSEDLATWRQTLETEQPPTATVATPSSPDKHEQKEDHNYHFVLSEEEDKANTKTQAFQRRANAKKTEYARIRPQKNKIVEASRYALIQEAANAAKKRNAEKKSAIVQISPKDRSDNVSPYGSDVCPDSLSVDEANKYALIEAAANAANVAEQPPTPSLTVATTSSLPDKIQQKEDHNCHFVLSADEETTKHETFQRQAKEKETEDARIHHQKNEIDDASKYAEKIDRLLKNAALLEETLNAAKKRNAEQKSMIARASPEDRSDDVSLCDSDIFPDNFSVDLDSHANRNNTKQNSLAGATVNATKMDNSAKTVTNAPAPINDHEKKLISPCDSLIFPDNLSVDFRDANRNNTNAEEFSRLLKFSKLLKNAALLEEAVNAAKKRNAEKKSTIAQVSPEDRSDNFSPWKSNIFPDNLSVDFDSLDANRDHTNKAALVEAAVDVAKMVDSDKVTTAAAPIDYAEKFSRLLNNSALLEEAVNAEKKSMIGVISPENRSNDVSPSESDIFPESGAEVNKAETLAIGKDSAEDCSDVASCDSDVFRGILPANKKEIINTNEFSYHADDDGGRQQKNHQEHKDEEKNDDSSNIAVAFQSQTPSRATVDYNMQNLIYEFQQNDGIGDEQQRKRWLSQITEVLDYYRHKEMEYNKAKTKENTTNFSPSLCSENKKDAANLTSILKPESNANSASSSNGNSRKKVVTFDGDIDEIYSLKVGGVAGTNMERDYSAFNEGESFCNIDGVILDYYVKSVRSIREYVDSIDSRPIREYVDSIDSPMALCNGISYDVNPTTKYASNNGVRPRTNYGSTREEFVGVEVELYQEDSKDEISECSEENLVVAFDEFNDIKGAHNMKIKIIKNRDCEAKKIINNSVVAKKEGSKERKTKFAHQQGNFRFPLEEPTNKRHGTVVAKNAFEKLTNNRHGIVVSKKEVNNEKDQLTQRQDNHRTLSGIEGKEEAAINSQPPSRPTLQRTDSMASRTDSMASF